MVPIVSYNYGAASLPRVKRTIKLTICTAMAIMAVGCLIFQLFPQQLLMFFNASEEMLSIGSVALRIISVSFVAGGLRHHCRFRVSGYRQPAVQSDYLCVPPAGGAAARWHGCCPTPAS